MLRVVAKLGLVGIVKALCEAGVNMNEETTDSMRVGGVPQRNTWISENGINGCI